MTDEDDTLITVACPQCEERRFSFSRNAVEGGGVIRFKCGRCESFVEITCTRENKKDVINVSYC